MLQWSWFLMLMILTSIKIKPWFFYLPLALYAMWGNCYAQQKNTFSRIFLYKCYWDWYVRDWDKTETTKKWSWFQDRFWEIHHYWLPTLVCSSLLCFSFLTLFLFLFHIVKWNLAYNLLSPCHVLLPTFDPAQYFFFVFFFVFFSITDYPDIK